MTDLMINSPPVIKFSIKDSAGNNVKGLKLAPADAAAKTADPTCSGSNLTLGIAKLIQPAAGSAEPSVWQSLISRQRYFDAGGTPDVTSVNTTTNQNAGKAPFSLSNKIAPKYRYGVVEATTDPKPVFIAGTITPVSGTTSQGTFTNPADGSATTDPTKRIVGILEEDATGIYTYRFATDVTTALLMADAVDVKNVSQGKVANNGQLAVKDGKTVHRISVQTCFKDPVTGLRSGHPLVVDFTINADGTTTPVTSGGKLAFAKQVVSSESCQQCHATNPGHGGRGKTDYCVTCHNPGTFDYNTNNVLDFKKMIHGIHQGKELAANYQVNAVVAKYTDTTNKAGLGAGIVYGTGFPQETRNCTKCHDNTKAAQADNYKNVPSRNACGGCHNGINFATGKGLTLADAAAGLATSTYGHIGGIQTDDTNCHLCHSAAAIVDYHKTNIPSTHNPVVTDGVPTVELKLLNVSVDSSKFVNADFQILVNGAAVALNTYASGADMITGLHSRPSYNAVTNTAGGMGPNFMVAYATAQDGITAPSDWNSGHDPVYLNDLWAGTDTTNIGTLTLKAGTTTTYTAVIKGSSATSSKATHTLAVPAGAGYVTAIMKDSFTADATVLTDAGRTDSASGKAYVTSKPSMLAVSGQARRVIIDQTKCEACHDRLGTAPNFHTGNYSTLICAGCHIPNQGGSTGWSASFRVWVHGIHGASKRTVPFTWHAATIADNYSMLAYPGNLKKCDTCHADGTYDFSASAYTTAVTDNFLYVQAATGKIDAAKASNLYTVPQNAKPGDPLLLASAPGNTLAGVGVAYSTKDSKGNQSLVIDALAANPGVNDFGSGWSINTATGLLAAKTTQDNNLVTSPITAVCSSCHDAQSMISHMTATGNGSFYRPRAAAILDKEQCLFCHGPGKLVPIKDYHGGTSTPPAGTAITTWSPGWY